MTISTQMTAAEISTVTPTGFGTWSGEQSDLENSAEGIRSCLVELEKPVFVLRDSQGLVSVTTNGHAHIAEQAESSEGLSLIGMATPLSIEQLGDESFCSDYGLRYPYMCGAMANGISSVELVEAAANIGLLASFGAGGLILPEIEKGLDRLVSTLNGKPWCVNLIYNPSEKGHEDAVVDRLLARDIHLIEASAYMALTSAVVRYRLHGIHRNAQGEIETPNRIIAKASRVEVATRWFNPPPKKLLQQLLDNGDITEEQLELAAQIPMAQDLTIEADSGGHTDNRPAISLLPTIIALRDRIQAEFKYSIPLRVGAAGGIATPASAAAAFSMGAAYIVTGTVNQACIESGTSDTVRSMLADAQQADVAMAPAVDMFEMGVELQVLKRGTLFAMRAKKLYEAYRKYDSIEAIPDGERLQLEKTIFRAALTEIWQLTHDFFQQRDPREVQRAETDPKHKMALIFRWYLGLSSRWANAGDESRQADFQIWCGPAMGAFNEWTKGSFLQQTDNRRVVTVAMNLLFGAALVSRINQLRYQGVRLPDEAINSYPLEQHVIEGYLS